MSNLDIMIEEGRLIRQAWTGTDGQGRHTACLLASLAPACGTMKSVSFCPADVMPLWFAHLTPFIDDSGSDTAWPAMVRRYADLANRWHVLTPEAWVRLDYKARKIAVTYNKSEDEAVLNVVKLLDRAIDGDFPTSDEWAAAAAAAAATATATAAAAAATAAAAAWAATTAAAATAAEAAAWATKAATKAAASSSSSWAETAAAAAADNITDQILSAIDEEIKRA